MQQIYHLPQLDHGQTYLPPYQLIQLGDFLKLLVMLGEVIIIMELGKMLLQEILRGKI